MEKQYERYIRDVQEGRQVVCEYVRLAVERHVRDLQASEYEEYPYIFIHGEADKAVGVISRMHTHRGKVGQVELQDYQAFIIASIFGWRMREDATEYRYKEAWVSTGRKSGKSWLAGALLIYFWAVELAQGRKNDYFCIANSERQAKEAFEAVQGIASRSPHLRKTFSTSYREKVVDKLGSEFILLAPSRNGRNEGSWPAFVIIDEWALAEDSQHITELSTGQGGLHNRFLLYTSTSGKLCHGYPGYEKDAHGLRVLRGQAEDDTTFFIRYSLDAPEEIHNPHCWVKANPNASLFNEKERRIFEKTLRKSVEEQTLDDTLRKYGNIFLSDSSGFISEVEWESARREYDFSQVAEGAVGVHVGIDASLSNDFTSFCILSQPILRSGLPHRIHHITLIPRGVYASLPSHLRKKVEQSSHVRVSSGPTISEGEVMNVLREISRSMNILTISYDRAYLSPLVSQFRDFALDTTYDIPQNTTHVSMALERLEELVKGGDLVHPGDFMIDWEKTNMLVLRKGSMRTLERRNKNDMRKIDIWDALLCAINGQTIFINKINS